MKKGDVCITTKDINVYPISDPNFIFPAGSLVVYDCRRTNSEYPNVMDIGSYKEIGFANSELLKIGEL